MKNKWQQSIVVLVGIFLFAQGIAESDTLCDQSKDKSIPMRTSLYRVISNPGSFDGCHIITQGVFKYKSQDPSVLYSDLSSYEYDAYLNVIEIILPENAPTDQYDWRTGSFVTVEGVFVQNHVSLYPAGRVMDIKKIEILLKKQIIIE